MTDTDELEDELYDVIDHICRLQSVRPNVENDLKKATKKALKLKAKLLAVEDEKRGYELDLENIDKKIPLLKEKGQELIRAIGKAKENGKQQQPTHLEGEERR